MSQPLIPNLNLQYQIEPTTKIENGILTISGEALDDSINANNWQVPETEQDYFCAVSGDAQIRVDHGESTEDVKGKVKTLKRIQTADGRNIISFTAEVAGDHEFLNKLQKQYLKCVSPRVVGDCRCSNCNLASRDSHMNFTHLCSGAYEVVHRPRMTELSIVPQGAFVNSRFSVAGFKAAMTETQHSLIASFHASQKPTVEQKTELDKETKKEKKPLSTEQNIPTMEDIKKAIDEAVKPLLEAVAKATVASEKSVKDAEEASTTKFQALAAKLQDDMAKQIKAQPIGKGKGMQGALNEIADKVIRPGTISIPSYFKDLRAAAAKQQHMTAQTSSGGLE